MADGIELNAGSGGSTVLTDETASGHAQVVKIGYGANADATVVGADANGLDVDVTRSALPTGAATSAKQDTEIASLASIDGKITAVNTGAVTISAALPAGNNNVGDVDVASVVPGTGATNLGKAEDAGHTSGDVGVMALTVRQDSAAALGQTDADYQPLITDANGRLYVNASGVTLTVASHAVTNAGTFAVQVDGAALTSLQLIDDAIVADDAAFTPATTKVMMAGFEADESSTDSVNEGDAAAARVTLDRKLIVTPQPHGAGGLSIFRSLDLDETEEQVSANPCCVYGMWVTNTATATRFIKFYNDTAANVSVGSTTPLITIGIPGNTSDDVAGLLASAHGIMFDTALSVAATTGVADADTGAPGGNEIIINIFYKA